VISIICDWIFVEMRCWDSWGVLGIWVTETKCIEITLRIGGWRLLISCVVQKRIHIFLACFVKLSCFLFRCLHSDRNQISVWFNQLFLQIFNRCVAKFFEALRPFRSMVFWTVLITMIRSFLNHRRLYQNAPIRWIRGLNCIMFSSVFIRIRVLHIIFIFLGCCCTPYFFENHCVFTFLWWISLVHFLDVLEMTILPQWFHHGCVGRRTSSRFNKMFKLLHDI